MRFDTRRCYTHPVLGQQEHDYPGKMFVASIEPKLNSSGRRLAVEAEYRCDVPSITNLIDTGKAQFAVWVYSASTLYRDLFVKPGPYVSMSIDTNLLNGRIEFHPLVVSTEDIDLPLQDSHPAFGTGNTRVAAGAPLAVHRHTHVTLGDTGPIDHIFNIAASEDQPLGVWEVQDDPAQPQINLRAHTDTYREFKRAREANVMNKWALQAVCVPALSEALRHFRKLADDPNSINRNDRGKWISVVAQKLDDLGITFSKENGFDDSGVSRSAMWTAQRLLGDPLANPLGTNDHDTNNNETL